MHTPLMLSWENEMIHIWNISFHCRRQNHIWDWTNIKKNEEKDVIMTVSVPILLFSKNKMIYPIFLQNLAHWCTWHGKYKYKYYLCHVDFNGEFSV